MLENIDAGLTPLTTPCDYSDVTVIDADGRRIPWPDAGEVARRSSRQHLLNWKLAGSGRRSGHYFDFFHAITAAENHALTLVEVG